MIIRILQVIAVTIVVTIVSSGILLSIWPELASMTQGSLETVSDQFKAKTNKSSGTMSDLPARSKPPEKPKRLAVHSYEKASQYSLKLWELMKATTGHIDSTKFPSESNNKSTPVQPAILELSGWAGHSSLGMRFGQIIFSMCGTIVGSTVIDNDRPDVAKNVHVNLLRSGWYARIDIAHLPTCADNKLRAWGLALTGKILWPLNGMAVIKQKHRPANKTSDVQANLNLLHPDRVAPPRLRKIKIKSARVNLRRCASTSCNIVGKIKGGEHRGYIVERHAEWALLQLNAGAGWMARHLFTDLPADQ